MNRKTLSFLMFAFVILGAIALFQAQQIPPQVFDSQATLQSFKWIGQTLNMSLDSIIAIRLREPQTGLTLIINRDNSGNWNIPGSEETLDQTAATGIAKTVTLLPYRDAVSMSPSTNLQDFGFNPEGNLALEIVLNNGQAHAIHVGALTPNQLAYYALADDLSQIFVLERGAIDYLRKNLNNPPLT